jgi:hypothetical protein
VKKEEWQWEEYSHPDVVHQDKDGWYFWDETWANRQGPYRTKELAQSSLDYYCREYLGHPS